MGNIAELGFSVDSSQLKSGKAALDALVPSAQKAENATNAFNAAAAGISRSSTGAATGINSFANAVSQAANGSNTAAKAALNAGTAMGTVQRAAAGAAAGAATLGLNTGNAAASIAKLNGSLNGVGPAANASGSALNRLGATAGANINKLQSSSSNIAAQFQDIGVTAAAGMNPLLIALQQGTQLSAAFAGGGLKNVGAALLEVLNPMSLLTIAAVALAAVLIEKLMTAFQSTTTEIEKNVKAMKDAATAADFFGQAQQMLGPLFDTTTGKLKTQNSVLAQTIKLQAQYNVLAAQAARIDATKALKKIGQPTLLEGMFANAPAMNAGTAGFNAAGGDQAIKNVEALRGKLVPLNSVLTDFSAAINGKSLSTKGLDKATNAAMRMVDALDKMGKLGSRKALEVKKSLLDLSIARGQEFANDEAIDSITSGKLGKDLFAYHRDKKPKAPKKPPHDQWADIVQAGQNDAATQNARAAAAGMQADGSTKAAEAAATLTEKTKLLNEANSKGIKLTDGMRATIDKLAASYGVAKVAADNAEGLQKTLQASDKDIQNLQDQNALIGVYGRQLAYATEMARQLAQAKQSGMTNEAIAAAMPQFQQKANTFADASVSGDSLKFTTQATQAYESQTRALTMQQAALNMSAEDAAKYTAVQSVLNDALNRHIVLSASDIVTITQQQSALVDLQTQLSNTKDAWDFTRDAVKGFVSDLRSGLEQGKSLFATFANAVIDVLNKVIDKLVDVALNSALGSGNSAGGFLGALGSMLGIGGGASSGAYGVSGSTGIYAKGGAFDRSGPVHAFANGGIVSSPTLFKFAKGTGLMGEAGPEAIMPLKRGRNGSLGVQMHGQAANNNQPPAVNVTNHYTISGAVSSSDVQAGIRASAEQTKDDVKRSVMGWISEFQQNGGLN